MQKVERLVLVISGKEFQSGSDIVVREIVEIKSQTNVQLVIAPVSENVMRRRRDNPTVNSEGERSIVMLRNVIDGIETQDALIENGEPTTRLMVAPEITGIETYYAPRALYQLSKGRIVVLAGNSGFSDLSADSAVVQRAHELDAVIFKATTDKNLIKNEEMVGFRSVTCRQAISEQPAIMDATALMMCEQSNIPIFVFNISDLHRLPEIIDGDYSFGTLIEG